MPPRLAALVTRALAKEPRDRFATMSDVVAELEACGRGDVPPPSDGAQTMIVPPPPTRQRVRRGRDRSRRFVRALVLALIVILLVAGAALGAYVIASGLSGDDNGDGGSSGGTAIALQGVRAYDPRPPGDNSEHDDEAPLATDGSARTFWKTETYNTFFKPGVGLVLDAGAAAR